MSDGGQERAAERLRVWSADPEAAAPLLAAMGAGAPLDGLPASPGEGPLLLLYHAPAVALARALAGGLDPEAAEEAWSEEARALLALHRAARRRVRLVELSAARADPAAFCALFGHPAPENPFTEPDTASDPILRLLAQRLILGSAPLAALAAELEAASADLTGGAGLATDDPLAAWRAHGALAQAGREAELLKAQHGAVLDELAALAADRDAQKDAAEQAGREAEGLKAQHAAAQQAAAEQAGREADQLRAQQAAAERARQEAELLKAQNGAMMEELEALARSRQQLEERVAQLGQGLDSYQAQVGALERAMAALRDRMARKEESLHAAGQMVQDLDARAARLKADLARARDEAGQQAARAATAEAARDAGQAEAEALRAELRRITSSRSFRLTAPLRRMRALIGSKP